MRAVGRAREWCYDYYDETKLNYTVDIVCELYHITLSVYTTYRYIFYTITQSRHKFNGLYKPKKKLLEEKYKMLFKADELVPKFCHEYGGG